jgi:hypothetical protein
MKVSRQGTSIMVSFMQEDEVRPSECVFVLLGEKEAERLAVHLVQELGHKRGKHAMLTTHPNDPAGTVWEMWS